MNQSSAGWREASVTTKILEVISSVTS